MTQAVGDEQPTAADDDNPRWWDDLQSVPQMKQAAIDQEKTDPAGSVLFGKQLKGIKEASTVTLMHRVETVENPLIAWALHAELDTRGVPPCLRPWMPEVSRQTAFIATLADLRWLAARHPEHVTSYERPQGIFRYEVGDDRWHKAALWAYRQCRGARHMLAKRLGLTEAMRCHTLAMPDARQSADRMLLRKNFQNIREAMVIHGLNHPDKSGATTPEAVADRRMKLLSTYVLMGRNQTETLEALKLVTGVAISRQTLKRQLEAAATTGDAARIVFGSYGRPPQPKVGDIPNTPQTRARARSKGVRLHEQEGGA